MNGSFLAARKRISCACIFPKRPGKIFRKVAEEKKGKRYKVARSSPCWWPLDSTKGSTSQRHLSSFFEVFSWLIYCARRSNALLMFSCVVFLLQDAPTARSSSKSQQPTPERLEKAIQRLNAIIGTCGAVCAFLVWDGGCRIALLGFVEMLLGVRWLGCFVLATSNSLAHIKHHWLVKDASVVLLATGRQSAMSTSMYVIGWLVFHFLCILVH